jgi:uncharacterized protein YegJ (DUF2314 family)
MRWLVDDRPRRSAATVRAAAGPLRALATSLAADSLAPLLLAVNASLQAAVDVREHGFTVQAPLEGGNDPDRVEQAWFCVKRFDAGQVEGALLEKPRSRDDLEAGSVLRIDPTTISDWRVEMPEGDFGPERWQDILPAVDRLRGL